MEANILQHFNFQFNAPNVLDFFHRFILFQHNFTDKQYFLCIYTLEQSLLTLKCRQYPNSLMAAAVIFLTNKLFRKNIAWTNSIQEITHYKEDQLKPCARDLCIILQNVSSSENLQQTAVKRKYAQSKYLFISNLKLEKIN